MGLARTLGGGARRCDSGSDGTRPVAGRGVQRLGAGGLHSARVRDWPTSDPSGSDPHSVLFVGSFIHQPNVDCATRLARDIFPAVRERVPEATLRLVGSHAPAHVLALAGAGITVHSDVPDVRPYLNRAAVVAMPIKLGGGMRVKVLEAITGGKAVVASPVALAGLSVHDGTEVIVAERDPEFVDAIASLLRESDRRVAIARAARRWAEANLNADRQIQEYEALYTRLTANSGLRVA